MNDAADLERMVNAAQDGDREAIGALFDRYYVAVYRYAHARLGNAADAEDAAADTFAAMVRTLPRFQWRGVPFEAWLFRIAMSRVVDIARRRGRVHSAGTDVGAAVPDPDADPARLSARLEERRELLARVERLPRDQRDVVMLRFFLQRSIAETARALGRTEGSIKQLQLRAIANLRKRTER